MARWNTTWLRPWPAALPMNLVRAQTKPSAIRPKTGRMVVRTDDMEAGPAHYRAGPKITMRLFTAGSATLSRRPFAFPGIDQSHQIGHDAVQIEILGRIDLGDAQLLEHQHILGRDDAAGDDRHMAEPRGAHAVHHLAHQGHMRARQDREADDMNALFERCRDDALWRQGDTLIRDFEAAIGGAHRDLLGTVGMAVEARLADQEFGLHAELAGERLDRLADIHQGLRRLTAHEQRDACRGAIFAEDAAQDLAPFARGYARLGASDRRLHDVAILARGRLQALQCGGHCLFVPRRAPGLQFLDL